MARYAVETVGSRMHQQLWVPAEKLDGCSSSVVGRIATDEIFDARFVVLGHNMIRGAAGAALLNAELLVARGML